MRPAPEQVTQILGAVVAGDAQAAEKLLPLVYEELRRLAAARMAKETPGQTLQPTALVHEAWLRLVQGRERSFANRGHFFAAAAEAMRRILIEAARRKQSQQRGGHLQREELQETTLVLERPTDEILAVDEALSNLAGADPLAAELVKLRYFVGLSLPDAAKALGISARTADRVWAYARARLHQELKGELAL